ncbi:unnamed protein product [Amoebophrya sp. A25]|nr:unnamed protein product [Amoebophrya sp. A25]|eukprot:GSA25T00017441001.1
MGNNIGSVLVRFDRAGSPVVIESEGVESAPPTETKSSTVTTVGGTVEPVKKEQEATPSKRGRLEIGVKLFSSLSLQPAALRRKLLASVNPVTKDKHVMALMLVEQDLGYNTEEVRGFLLEEYGEILQKLAEKCEQKQYDDATELAGRLGEVTRFLAKLVVN